jgi:NitT/TauT family transport system substrate-binding protein
MLFGSPSSRRWLALGGAVAALALVAAGCGSSSSKSSSSKSKPAAVSTRKSSAPVHATTVTFAYVPYSDDAALFLGLERGVFSAHGLSVKLVPEPSPAPIVAGLASGTDQFGFVTTNVLLDAVGHGVPIKCVSTVDGNQTPNPNGGSAVLLTAPGSGIHSVKQLDGKTVAVVQLNSLNSVDVQELVTQAGGNASSLHLVALPFPQMPEALKDHRVAAAVVVSPFSATAIKEGATPIAHPNSELFPNGTLTCIAASDSYIASHPAQVKAWYESIDESAAYAKTHRSQALATLSKYLKLTPAAAQHAVLDTDWNTTINVASVKKQEQLLQKFGALPKPVPVSDLFAPPWYTP